MVISNRQSRRTTRAGIFLLTGCRAVLEKTACQTAVNLREYGIGSYVLDHLIHTIHVYPSSCARCEIKLISPDSIKTP
ncbi:hypothetical protein GQ53DRAFT_95230 [Thozetella sp. PMI_491]|nr:hypothetical protein GQ53DRAFT_95230 [Thozetella sp. PMI_491]